MTQNQWKNFRLFCEEFQAMCEKWQNLSQKFLLPLQKNAAIDTPFYDIENAVVYNSALDEVTPESEIKLIVIGDNPGKDEQLSKNKKYLVGQSGKIAEGFFRNHSELKIDFRKNVIILNKTPIHSAKTAHLKKIAKADFRAQKLILESQIFMAEKTAQLHKALFAEDEQTELWIVGYAELKNRGIFVPYKNRLAELYANENAWKNVFAFQHFSMNRFLIDLKKFTENSKSKSIKENLHLLGTSHKLELFN